jgi:hypothetical protein
MKTEMEKELFRAAVRTLEGLGFLLPSEEPGENRGLGCVEEAARVDFQGHLTGRLVVRMTGELLSLVTANMLGRDDTPPAEKQTGVLGEIANVVCGNLLPRLADPRDVIRFQSPWIGPADPDPGVEGQAPAAAVRIGFERGCVDLELFLRQGREDA